MPYFLTNLSIGLQINDQFFKSTGGVLDGFRPDGAQAYIFEMLGTPSDTKWRLG